MKHERPFHAELELKLNGNASISEFNCLSGSEYILSTTEITEDDSNNGIGWQLEYCTDTDHTEHEGYAARVDFYHIKDKKSGRVFHVDINIYLNKDDLLKVRDFCTYLISLNEPSP